MTSGVTPISYGRIAPGIAEAEILIRGTYITRFGVVPVPALKRTGPAVLFGDNRDLITPHVEARPLQLHQEYR
ncbi:hypothetical protein QOM21_31685 [Streptomyces sp. Pv4-95]|uniref:hypothetical protein n=1 Tax=Streptomyces sp. Pv4-95 TaxID=3049543 RepID=UPI003891D484